jgi:hypothetical protein
MIEKEKAEGAFLQNIKKRGISTEYKSARLSMIEKEKEEGAL